MKYKTYKLEDVCFFQEGYVNPKQTVPEYFDGNIKWLRANDLQNRYVYNTSRTLTEEGFNSAGKSAKLFKPDTIAISKSGTIGRLGLLKDYMCGNRAVINIETNRDILDIRYLYYFLLNNRQYIESLAQGSVQKNLYIFILEKVDINIPDMDTQQKVLNFLYKIDKKIELNNQINDNLHKLTKNLYSDTFLNNKNTNWAKERLGNYLTVERGLSYKGKFLSEKGVPMINLGNVMPDGVFRLEKNKYYTGEYKEKVTANVGDIVVANTDMTQNREVIGTPVIIPSIYEGKVIFSHHIYGLKNLVLPKMYVFYSLLTDEWNGIAGGSATGTTVLALPKDTIEEYMIPIPDNETLSKFEEVAEQIQSKREQILLENIELEKLRNTLLPKLMNGEIDLEKVEVKNE